MNFDIMMLLIEARLIAIEEKLDLVLSKIDGAE